MKLAWNFYARLEHFACSSSSHPLFLSIISWRVSNGKQTYAIKQKIKTVANKRAHPHTRGSHDSRNRSSSATTAISRCCDWSSGKHVTPRAPSSERWRHVASQFTCATNELAKVNGFHHARVFIQVSSAVKGKIERALICTSNFVYIKNTLSTSKNKNKSKISQGDGMLIDFKEGMSILPYRYI